MAKKRRSPTRTTRQAPSMPAADAALAAAVPVIDVPAGATLEVIVDGQ